MEFLHNDVMKFIILTGILTVFTIVEFVRYFNNKGNKKRKTECIGLLVITVLMLSFTTYYATDLVKKDFIEESGTFLYYGHAGKLSQNEVTAYFETEEDTSDGHNISRKNAETLSQGKTYKFTYAKRTNIIVSITEE